MANEESQETPEPETQKTDVPGMNDLLDQIGNAHLACMRASAQVFEATCALKRAKNDLKTVEGVYDNCVDVLLELTAKLQGDQDRPLLKHIEEKASSPDEEDDDDEVDTEVESKETAGAAA